VFATGGIGGVHRGAELSFDVSADLTELGRTPVLVVCAGVKSILDIPKTLEVLETQGETSISYSNSLSLSYSLTLFSYYSSFVFGDIFKHCNYTLLQSYYTHPILKVIPLLPYLSLLFFFFLLSLIFLFFL
jgi:Indigoidine synthase A like protein